MWMPKLWCWSAVVLITLAGCKRDEGADDKVASGQQTTPPETFTESGSSAPDATTRPISRRTAAVDPTSFDIKGKVAPDERLAKIIQTLAIFDHPESLAPSGDSRYLFVTSSAMTLSGFRAGKGYISKLEILEDGRLQMIKPNFVEGLNAPQGVAILPKDTKKYPAGSLFVCVGATLLCDEKGARITEIERCKPSVLIIDPNSGSRLGSIQLGPGTVVAKSIYHTVLNPNGITFDRDGNLYVGDTGNTGRELDPEISGRPGILRIRFQNIDAYSDNQVQGDVAFMPVRHAPNGIYYSKTDDALYWTTCDGEGPAGGAVYRMPRKEFPLESMVSNVAGDMGPLEGLSITPGRQAPDGKSVVGLTLLMSRTEGDISLITRRRIDTLRFVNEDQPIFSTPADMKLLTLPNGWNILYLPEQDPSAMDHGKQRLRVILLPSLL